MIASRYFNKGDFAELRHSLGASEHGAVVTAMICIKFPQPQSGGDVRGGIARRC